MNGDMHRIDELFRNGMDRHLEMPSPLVWDKIEEELDKKERRRPFILFYSNHKKYVAGLAAILLGLGLLLGGYCYLKTTPELESTAPKINSISNSTASTSGESNKQTSHSASLSNAKTKQKTSHHASSTVDQTTAGSTSSPSADKAISTPITHTQKENQKNISTPTQRNQIPAHLPNIVPDKLGLGVKVQNHSDKLTENSKEHLGNKNPSNVAVANLPYVPKSAPSINKTDVAGSRAIIQSSGNVNHNASAVQVAEEQTKLALIAGVNPHQHDLGPIVNSIVPFKPLPNSVKAPTIQASATPYQPSTTTDRQKANNKRFHITLTPVALYQDGKIKVLEKMVNPPVPLPGQPPILWNPPSVSSVNATTYTMNAGLLADIHFKNGLSLQTGLTLSTQYFRVNTADGIAVERPDGSIKYLVEYNIGVVYLDPKFGTNPAIGTIQPFENIKTSLHYAQVPLLLNWHIGKGKLQGVVTIGGNYTMLTGLSLNSDIAQERVKQDIVDKEVNLRFNYLNAIGGLGLKWNFNKRLAFVVSSQYQQSLTPFLKTDFIKAYPGNLTTQAGIQVGIFN